MALNASPFSFIFQSPSSLTSLSPYTSLYTRRSGSISATYSDPKDYTHSLESQTPSFARISSPSALTNMPYNPPRPVQPPSDPAVGSTSPPPQSSPQATRIPFPERFNASPVPIPHQSPSETSPSSSISPPFTETRDLPTPRPARIASSPTHTKELDLTSSLADLSVSPTSRTRGSLPVVDSPLPLAHEAEMDAGEVRSAGEPPFDPSSESDLPTLSHSHDTPSQASSTSIASLSSDNQDSMTASVVHGDGMMSPATSVSEQPELDDAVARYKEGLYAYTVSVSLECGRLVF